MIETGVARRFNARIPLRDGVTLSADLALPEALPAPAVVARYSRPLALHHAWDEEVTGGS